MAALGDMEDMPVWRTVRDPLVTFRQDLHAPFQ